MLKFLGIRRLSTRELCTLAMLVALTVVLGAFCTIRPTDTIKISTKFIAVFTAAALFGPVWGGVCGALADVVSMAFTPVGGAIIWQITVIEFIYGFIYGLFFYRQLKKGAVSYVKIFICVSIEIIIFHYFATSYVLTSYGYFPTYETALLVRLTPALINYAFQLAGTVIMFNILPLIKKHMKGN